MRVSLSNARTRVERLAQRLRHRSDIDLAQTFSRMTDQELHDRRQELHRRAIELIQEELGPITAADTPEAVAERLCKGTSGRDLYEFTLATARAHIASLRGHTEHASIP